MFVAVSNIYVCLINYISLFFIIYYNDNIINWLPKETNMSSIGKNSSYLREVNKKSIINIIRSDSVSRSDIARITGLTKPAVSEIVDYLIRTGYIDEIGTKEISHGRHPKMLSLKSDSYYAIGVNINRDRCIMGFSDFSGRIVSDCIIDINDLPQIGRAHV